MITKEKVKQFVKDNWTTVVLAGGFITALGITRYNLKICERDLYQVNKLINKYITPFMGKRSCNCILKYIPDTDTRTVSNATNKLLEQIANGSVTDDIVTGVVYYVKK